MDSEGVLELLKRTAAEVVTPRFRALAETEVEEKRPGDLVTIADREAEEHLMRQLATVYPQALVVGEEAAFANPQLLAGLPNADHAFVIDPIDGTRNFVRGRDQHGVMLAELRGGITTRGWIWQPQTGRGYCAERGGGVRLNGEPITRGAPRRPPLGASSKNALMGFDAGGELSPVIASNFSCAFDYPALLHGDIDFMVWTSMHPWDHLAGSLMVTEQGGVSRTFDGLAYSVLSRSRGLLVAADTLSWMTVQQHWPLS